MIFGWVQGGGESLLKKHRILKVRYQLIEVSRLKCEMANIYIHPPPKFAGEREYLSYYKATNYTILPKHH